MPYATVEDLEAKSTATIPPAMAAVLLQEGEAILRASVPGLDAALLVGTVDPVLVRKVLTDAVLRVLRNPSGVTTQVVGPESATFSGQAQRAELQFLAAELALINPPTTGLSAGGYAIGSFRLGRPDWCGQSRDFWC